jgi:hypothetical protein
LLVDEALRCSVQVLNDASFMYVALRFSHRFLARAVFERGAVLWVSPWGDERKEIECRLPAWKDNGPDIELGGFWEYLNGAQQAMVRDSLRKMGTGVLVLARSSRTQLLVPRGGPDGFDGAMELHDSTLTLELRIPRALGRYLRDSPALGTNVALGLSTSNERAPEVHAERPRRSTGGRFPGNELPARETIEDLWINVEMANAQ